MKDPLYILDANVFIQAYKEYYAFEIAPGFWNSLITYSKKGILKILDKVYNEIIYHYKEKEEQDELQKWIQKNFVESILSSNEIDIIKNFRRLQLYVMESNKFSSPAKREFANVKVADGWLIAYAMSYEGITIVTEEKHRKDVGTLGKVPIPNICNEFEINWMDTFDMLKKLKIKLR